MITSKVNYYPNGIRIFDSEKNKKVFYLKKCPRCGVGRLRWITYPVTFVNAKGKYAISCYNCEASTDFFPSKIGALKGELKPF